MLSEQRSTLDLKHKERLNFFKQERNSITQKETQLSQIEQTLSELYEKREQRQLGLMGYQQIRQLEQDKFNLAREIEQIKQNKPEYEYLLGVGSIVHQYFDHVQKTKPNTNNKPTRDLSSYFKDTQTKAPPNSGSKVRKADFNDHYLTKVDPFYISKTVERDAEDPSYCYECQQYKDLDRTEAKLICQKCGSFENETLDSDKPSYNREQSHEISNFAYKRINHFKEILNQYQATENTNIPQDVYDIVLLEMNKERIYNLAKLDYKLVKKYLKKYKHRGYNKYYEHIPHIINRLNGISPPKFSPLQIEKLLNLFEKIQPAFEKHCPKTRSNFISYSYILYKFCELLCYDEFLVQFQLLKSDTKLREQEEIWKKICHEMNFQFIATL